MERKRPAAECYGEYADHDGNQCIKASSWRLDLPAILTFQKLDLHLRELALEITVRSSFIFCRLVLSSSSGDCQMM